MTGKTGEMAVTTVRDGEFLGPLFGLRVPYCDISCFPKFI